jgi:hypothetical protein
VIPEGSTVVPDKGVPVLSEDEEHDIKTEDEIPTKISFIIII